MCALQDISLCYFVAANLLTFSTTKNILEQSNIFRTKWEH